MSRFELHVGATSPTYLPLVTISSVGIDLSVVNRAVVRARKPNQTEIDWSGAAVTLPGPQTATSCPVQWELSAGEIDAAGTWRVEIDLYTPASSTSPIYTHAFYLYVVDRFGDPK